MSAVSIRASQHGGDSGDGWRAKGWMVCASTSKPSGLIPVGLTGFGPTEEKARAEFLRKHTEMAETSRVVLDAINDLSGGDQTTNDE